MDLVIEILDLDENPLADIDDALSGEGEELQFTFEADGLFIIRIRDFFGDSGSFTMTLE
jgi:hypothetical protein